MYELLGLIKDGKAPEKIKYEYSIYELTPERNDYYCKNEMRWFTNEINSLGALNNEVEIIEEPKKIEKLDIKQEKNIKNNWKWKCNGYNISTPQKIMADKLNELIDEINNLKEKQLIKLEIERTDIMLKIKVSEDGKIYTFDHNVIRKYGREVMPNEQFED